MNFRRYLILFLLLFCSFSHSQIYEICNWKNINLTTTIIDYTSQYDEQLTVPQDCDKKNLMKEEIPDKNWFDTFLSYFQSNNDERSSRENPTIKKKNCIKDSLSTNTKNHSQSLTYLQYFIALNHSMASNFNLPLFYPQYAEQFTFFNENKEEVTKTTLEQKYRINDICFLASSIKGKSIFKVNGSDYLCSDKQTNKKQHFYYCNTPEERQCSTIMSTIDNQGNNRFIYPRGPCLSDTYIQTLSNTFNLLSSCFNFSEREMNDLFALINHESSFIPNARSKTGARCAGQLTSRALVHLNVNIVLEKNPIYEIYMQALHQCPYLEKVLIPSDLLTNKEHQNLSYDTLVEHLYNTPITCSLISDISRCFFYTFLFQKTSLQIIKEQLSSVEEYMNSQDLEQFKTLLSYLAYNGGQNIIRTELKHFINQFISQCSSNSIDINECLSVKLNFNSLKNHFLSSLQEATDQSGELKYNYQTIRFPTSIQKDMEYFNNEPLMLKHLNTLNISQHITTEDIQNFFLTIQNQCLL